jgi:branched-chain amino acid transport system ATP-binding protein
MSERVLDVKDLKVSFGKAQVLDGRHLPRRQGRDRRGGRARTAPARRPCCGRCPGSTPRFETATLLGEPLPAAPYDVVMAGLVHVPERRRLFPGLTVQDNLELGARRLGKQARGSRAEDLERVFTLFPKLRERAGQAAGTLSGGEQQQCAIGRG